MSVVLFSFLRYGFALLFGVAVSVSFAGITDTKRNRAVLLVLSLLLLCIQVICGKVVGFSITAKLYPFITHLPLVLFLHLYLRRSWLVSTGCVLSAYLCCQAPRWIGAVFGELFGSMIMNHIGYTIAVPILFFLLSKYVAESVFQLMKKSAQACLLFCSIPFMYYIFDYVTTIYTNLLYSGSKWAVQFMPSVVSVFYFIFVILYHIEIQKQSDARQERDFTAKQLQLSKQELESMRKLQEHTRIYRHDLRHHLSLIGSYASKGELQKIIDYLAGVEISIDSVVPHRYCENDTVNLILSNFESKAGEDRILLFIDVKLPAELPISDIEICSIFYNSLENAFRAVSGIENEKLRKVYLSSFINNHKLVFSTENAYEGVIKMQGEWPTSIREEKEHGYGLKSMASIVEKHGGLYSFETEGSIFILQLMIPMKEESES
ncbi:MAG: GHKL domain-containing protein [Lachnospiraceae bacterium]